MERADVKDLEAAIRHLSEAVVNMKAERTFQIDEMKAAIKEMISRFTSELGRLETIIRGDGTNGARKAVLDRLRELERDVLEIKDSMINARAVQIEHVRGQWAIWPVLITSLLGTAASIVVALIK